MYSVHQSAGGVDEAGVLCLESLGAAVRLDSRNVRC